MVPGSADGEVLALREPVSFWGGFDAGTGRVVDRWHPDRGACLTGRVLVMRAARGSSSGSSVLAEAIRLGTGPLGIVLLARDAIVTVGAMVAAELYGSLCPVLLASREDWQAITESPHLRLLAEGDSGTIAIR